MLITETVMYFYINWKLFQDIKITSVCCSCCSYISTVELRYMKRDFYLHCRCSHNFKSDLIRIWTKCAFRVLFPHQWSVAKQRCLKCWRVMPQNCQKISLSRKGWCNKSTKLQFQLILARKNLVALKRYESIEVNRRTWTWALGDSPVNQQCHSQVVLKIWKETST